eukprot:CAMPEP_0172492370 /NCGR_PEP_ID=MMETSP1066-20121228/23520_1 /TAXON_ID=671091 /ORGANISM="Coscinodiscus wailesii, Strain CCMP2513" /LENGTH=73 /DNA_ID=CAMNT_0013261969 /DNA_START=28 /DNA_END=249 /DNA_ORIENTATION=-
MAILITGYFTSAGVCPHPWTGKMSSWDAARGLKNVVPTTLARGTNAPCGVPIFSVPVSLMALCHGNGWTVSMT